MEAGSRQRRIGSFATIFVLIAFSASAEAANRRTRNFIVDAPTEQLATAVAEAAESFRRDLAVYWLGEPLAPWPTPCPIRVVAGPNLAAQGVTTYNPRPVRDFQMEVIGTPQRILDSVLPHEVTHTILATHFGRPLPRWADEGICTTVEHSSERNKHEVKLREFLRSRRGIAMNQLFLMTEYPSDVLPMYAQGYSVCRFLIDQQGPEQFIAFLHDYMQNPSWTANIRKHYGYDSLKELQEYWLAWVAAGSGSVDQFAKTNPAGNPAATNPVASIAALPGAEVIPVSANARPNQPQSNMGLRGPRGNAVRPAVGPATAAIAARGNTNTGNTNTGNTNTGNTNTGNMNARASNPAAQGNGDGWYHRRKELAQAGSLSKQGTAESAVRPIVPPSVRESGPYSSAHPQPSQPVASGRISTDLAAPQATGRQGQYR